MTVTLIPCGPAANDSELKAFEHLKNAIQSAGAEGKWCLLSNLTFSVTNQLQSDEIDLVAIGPPGVRVLEIKHWTDAHQKHAPSEADRVTHKSKLRS